MRISTVRGALLSVLLLLVLLGGSASGQYAAAQPAKQNGFSFTAFWTGAYDTPEADRSMRQMKATGANWTSVIVTQYQENLASTTIAPTIGTPTDAEVIATIREAKSLGLKVMLKPHVDLWNDDDHWRGEIGLGYDETDWANWFSSYRQMIYHYARMARDEGVDQFAVGTELRDTELREQQWRDTIAGIRAIYSGPLVYAANDSGPELRLPWWDAVDFIGVDAYYPLTNLNNPTVAQLKNAWAPIVTRLAGLSARNGNKKIIFTEVGYRSTDGANRQPFITDNDAPLDLQEQADLFEALMQSVYDRPWFAGMFIWDWSFDPFIGGMCDKTNVVYDKPAENVIRRWYGAPTREIKPWPEVDETVSRSIYADSLAAGWQDWSWGSTRNFAATSPVQSGQRSISVTATEPWGALKLHHDGIDTTPYHYLEFWVRTNAATTTVQVFAYDANDKDMNRQPLDDCRYAVSAPPQPQTWTRVRIPLDHLRAAGRTITGFAFQASDAMGTFWLDGIRLVGAKGGGVNLPVIFSAVEDSHAGEAQPTKTFGAAKVLKVQNSSRDFNAYLKFNVSGLTAPIKKATLRLFATDGSDNSGAVFVVGNGWTEASLNWYNAPAISGAPAAAGKPAAARKWVEWDVTNVIIGDGSYSLAIRNNSTNAVGYSSREGSRPPQLVVEVGP